MRRIKEEIAAATDHIDELAAQLTAIEQKAGEAVASVKTLEDQQQGLQNELAEAQRHRADAEAHLAAIEQKLGEAVQSVKALEDQRQGLQNELAEAQRRRADAEVRLAALLQAAERTKGSDRLENVARDPSQSYRATRLKTATAWPILIFAFLASFLINAVVFGLIPRR